MSEPISDVRRGSALSNMDHPATRSPPGASAPSPDAHGSESSGHSHSDDNRSAGRGSHERRDSGPKNDGQGLADSYPPNAASHGSVKTLTASSIQAAATALIKPADGEPLYKKRKRSQRACVRCRGQKLKCDGVFPCGRCLKLKLACKEPSDPSASSSSLMVTSASQPADLDSAARNGQPSGRQILPSASPQRRPRHSLYHSNANAGAPASSSGAVTSSSSSRDYIAPAGVPAAPAHGGRPMGSNVDPAAGANGLPGVSTYPQHLHAANGAPPHQPHGHGPPHLAGPTGPTWDDISPVDFIHRLERLETTLERVVQRVDRESSISWSDLAPSDVLVRFERLESALDRIVQKLDSDRPLPFHEGRAKDRYGAPAEHTAQRDPRYLPYPPLHGLSHYAASPGGGNVGGGPLPPMRTNAGPPMHDHSSRTTTNGSTGGHVHEPRRAANRNMSPEESEVEIDELDGHSEMGPGSVEHTPANGRHAGLHGHASAGPAPQQHLNDRVSDVRSTEPGRDAPRSRGGGDDSRDGYDPIRGGGAGPDKTTRPSPMMDRHSHPAAPGLGPLSRSGRLPRIESGAGTERWHHDQRPGSAGGPGGSYPPYADRALARDGRVQHWPQPAYAE